MFTEWYALMGFLAVLAWFGMITLSIRSERARRAREAKMTPEQREVERREREAFNPIVLSGGATAGGSAGGGGGCGGDGGCGG